MAADVSCLMRLMNDGDSNESGKATAPITRDLLAAAGCSTLDSKELDLDLQVPSGWEKRLDLKSGKVYLQRCNNSCSSNSSSSTTTEKLNKSESCTKAATSIQDLNFPPSSKPLNLFDGDSSSSSSSLVDLKLVSLSSSSLYQSVCTLDKVKSALERAEKETVLRKRSISMSSLSSSGDVDQEERSSFAAAGCPSCLMYVLICRDNPKCPRCNTNVPLPPNKKPRIDLNITI